MDDVAEELKETRAAFQALEVQLAKTVTKLDDLVCNCGKRHANINRILWGFGFALVGGAATLIVRELVKGLVV